MADGTPGDPSPASPRGWNAHWEAQIDAWARTTPEQRLQWLEEAIQFAYEAGAIVPRGVDDGRSGYVERRAVL